MTTGRINQTAGRRQGRFGTAGGLASVPPREGLGDFLSVRPCVGPGGGSAFPLRSLTCRHTGRKAGLGHADGTGGEVSGSPPLAGTHRRWHTEMSLGRSPRPTTVDLQG